MALLFYKARFSSMLEKGLASVVMRSCGKRHSARTVPLSIYVTLGKLLGFSEYLFPHV